MKKLLFLGVFCMIFCSTVYAVKEYAKRFPTDTAMEVYTPNNPQPGGGTVTSVSGASPVTSTGGTTPTIGFNWSAVNNISSSNINWTDLNALQKGTTGLINWMNTAGFSQGRVATATTSGMNWQDLSGIEKDPLSLRLAQGASAQTVTSDAGVYVNFQKGIKTPLLMGTDDIYSTGGLGYAMKIGVKDSQLYDATNGGVTCFDWHNRYLQKFLFGVGAVTTFDWQNLAFPTLTSNGFLKTSGGNGTLGVSTQAQSSDINWTDINNLTTANVNWSNFTVPNSNMNWVGLNYLNTTNINWMNTAGFQQGRIATATASGMNWQNAPASGVTSVSGASPITSTGGTTPTIGFNWSAVNNISSSNINWTDLNALQKGTTGLINWMNTAGFSQGRVATATTSGMNWQAIPSYSETDPLSLHLDQTTPQEIINGSITVRTASTDNIDGGDIPWVSFRRTRGTIGTPSEPQNGDVLGALDVSPFDVSLGYVATGSFLFIQDAVKPGGILKSIPTAFHLYLSDGNLGATERFSIASSGTIKFPTLTSNGFLKTGSSDGTLSVDTASYLNLDQTTPQTVENGIPVITEGLTLGDPSGDYIKWRYGTLTDSGPLAGLKVWIMDPYASDLNGAVSLQKGGLYLQYVAGDDPPATENNAGVYFISEDASYISSLLQDNAAGNIVLMTDIIGAQIVPQVWAYDGTISFPLLSDGWLKVTSGALSSGTPPAGADIGNYFIITQASADLSNPVNLGALGTGLVKSTVAGAVSTISIDTNTYLTSTNIIKSFTVGETVTAGAICYLKSADGYMWLAKGDAEATSINLLGIALAGASSGAVDFLLMGDYTDSSLTIGVPYYLSVSTGGAKVTTRPATATNIVRVLGYATTATNFYFCPDNTWVTV